MVAMRTYLSVFAYWRRSSARYRPASGLAGHAALWSIAAGERERPLGAGSEHGPGETLPGEMLPDERLLWAGRPGRARVSAADAGFSAYLLAALAVVAGFCS